MFLSFMDESLYRFYVPNKSLFSKVKNINKAKVNVFLLLNISNMDNAKQATRFAG